MKENSFFKMIRELKDFLLLWASQAVSELGTAMTNYALTIWVYQQKGTSSSVTMLTLCTFLPTIFIRFLAGSLVDRWDKKRVMLLSDLAAALGTAAVFVLFSCEKLEIGHIYLINFLLSFMNAFQVPASFVATSLLVPRKHYTRAGGLQGISGAAISILAPALGSSLLVFGGMPLVLTFDLVSFALAFGVLLFGIYIPETKRAEKAAEEPFWQNCLGGVRFLREHKALLHLTLFLAAVNFLAKMGNDGMIVPFVLSRTGSDQTALGMVQTAVALGLLAGSLIVTSAKPAKDKAKLGFAFCAAVFSGNLVQSLSASRWVWCIAAFGSYLAAAVMNANLTAILRENVPAEMQGRVFSAKDTLSNCTIPLGLFLGGVLADHVFEPLMATEGTVQSALAAVFGTGSGAGIAVMFFFVGAAGMALSLSQLHQTVYRSLKK